MAVVIEAMRTYFFQRAAAVYFAVAGQIEMIADVTEAAVVDVVAAAILKAQGGRVIVRMAICKRPDLKLPLWR